MAEAPPPDADGVARALGAIPSGLFVVTCGKGEHAAGFLASFVQQVGFEPPAVTVAVRADRDVAQRLRDAGAFCVHVLAGDDKKHLAHFAKGVPPGEEAFAGLDVSVSDATGTAVLPGTLAQIECELVGESPSGWSDHILFCGRVVAGRRQGRGESAVHLRKNGLSY